MIVFLWLLSLLRLYNGIKAEEELASVIAVFRHGEITPLYFAPTDKYKELKYWQTKYGELTKFGQAEHFALGKFLRTRYKKFIPATYQKDDIYVRATNNNRSIKSAEANLAGLFPFSWKSIPIQTVPTENDTVLGIEKVCPKYQPKYQDFMKSENARLNPIYKELLEFISLNLGVNMTSLYNMSAPYETMVTEVKYNLKQPDWANRAVDYIKVFPDQMKIWADSAYVQKTATHEVARLATGRFFDVIASHLEAAAFNNQTENKLANKMAMYFGDKGTICNIKNTLIVDNHDATFASTLLFELWRNKTDNIL